MEYRQLGGSGLEDALVKARVRLSDEELEVARSSISTLQKAGISSVPMLVKALEDAGRDLSIRLTACSLLSWLGERTAGTAVMRVLEEEKNDGLVWEAARALIRLRAEGEDAVRMLLRVLQRGNPTSQSAAAYVLGWLGVADALPSLRSAALNQHLAPRVRGHAVEALGVMKAREAVGDLMTLLSNESPEIRYWAAYSASLQIAQGRSVGNAGNDTALHDMSRDYRLLIPQN